MAERFAAELAPCDACGARSPELLLVSPRLDGPLVRCRSCGLGYVGRRTHDYTFGEPSEQRSHELAQRVAALELVDHAVEDAEAPLRERVHADRLGRVAPLAPGRRLLDVGASTGGLVAWAIANGWDARGLEPEPGTSAQARARGLPVEAASLESAELEPASFDAITMFHVIEHLGSPRRGVAKAAELLAPGGVLAVETPTMDGPWFRLLRGRWRQLIPDHYFFFNRAALESLLRREGLEPLATVHVGKPVTLRFLADRVRRVHPGLGGVAARLVRAARAGDRVVHLTPGDVILCLARKPAADG